MSNLSYCRFRNTAKDLRDCAAAIEDELELEEHEARARLVALCREIVEADDASAIPDCAISDDDEESEEE